MSTFGKNLRLLREKLNYTQEELAQKLDTSKQVISRYETNQRTPKITVVKRYADILGVDLYTLLGDEEDIDVFSLKNVFPPQKTIKRPRLGRIACGQPIRAEENLETYDEVPENIQCDFTLKCEGDSMIGARINDGDIVYIRQQPDVENGEIAAVCWNNEMTLKRVYKNKDSIILQAENPLYSPIAITGSDLEYFSIIGKAVGFISIIK